MNPKTAILKKKANNLPLLPGVYIMKNSEGEIIYVGKAVKLKNRVTQYFGAGNQHTEKVKKMVESVDDFDYIICDSEFEALTLENSLIKQNMPKYNILLKDDKGYHYIKITAERWKKIEAVKMKEGKGEYIGPYNSGYIVRQTVDETLKIFKLPNCSRSFDKRSKPCLNYHIGICMAPCMGKVKYEDYLDVVSDAVRFIKNGGAKNVDIDILREKMEKAAEELNFEYAAKLRDRINAISRVYEKQKVISTDNTRQDIIASCFVGEMACVEVFIFKNGHLTDEEHYFFDGVESKSALYSTFLLQFYDKSDIPRKIITDSQIFDKELLERWLGEKSDHSVGIEFPKQGEKKKLVDMCGSNAAEHLSKKIERNLREASALDELGKLIGMNNPPRYIEAYDISNTAGVGNVAGMVVFQDGRPLKKAYRKFKIKSFSGQDDFRSMAEVIGRRFEEYKKGEDEAFSKMPDLILLDGGQGQLSAVKAVLDRLGITVPVFGMVKDNKHRTDAIAAEGGKIAIKSNRRAFTLVTSIQNEVHRYAIGYHKTVRKISTLESVLLKIDGVGPKISKSLMKHFKTIDNIKSATVEELAQADGVNLKKAENIRAFFDNME